MSGLRQHVLLRLKTYGIALGWQALMIATAFIGYCVASALTGRMAPSIWFAGIYIGAGLLIQSIKELVLYHRSVTKPD